MEIQYKQVGEVLIPDLELTDTNTTPIQRWGRMRREYLMEHRSCTYSIMVMEQTLFPHLREIDRAAQERMDRLMPQLAKEAGATEELKRKDPMKWVGLMNTCKAQVEEIIREELIYN